MKPTQRYAYSRNGEQGRVDEKCLVRVQLPSVHTSDDGTVRYHIRITNVRTGQVWEVAHRFSEFLKLRNELIEFFAKTDKKCPGCCNYEKVLKLFEFPRKHIFTSVTPVVINYRKKALCSFVALLASHTFTTTPKCPTCSGFPFTGVRDWLTSDMVFNASNDGDGSPINEAIRDTMNVKDFTNYHPVTNSMPVDQEGRFVGKSSRSKRQPKSKREIRGPPPPQTHRHEDLSESQLLFESFTGAVNRPPSPPSVDEFVMPTPSALVTVTSARMMEKSGEEDDNEDGFESFVFSSIAPSDVPKDGKHEDKAACEPPASDDDSDGEKVTKKTKHFKFARSSIANDNERLSGLQSESSMVKFDCPDDDEEDEGLNMDFMNCMSAAPTSTS